MTPYSILERRGRKQYVNMGVSLRHVVAITVISK